MNINIFEVTGKAALSMQNGDKIYEIIKSNIGKGEEIDLDFAQVKIFATPFFNASLGRLASEYNTENLLKIIKVINIPKNGEDLIKTSMESSEEIKKSEEYQDKLAAIFEVHRGEEDDR